MRSEAGGHLIPMSRLKQHSSFGRQDESGQLLSPQSVVSAGRTHEDARSVECVMDSTSEQA